MQKDFFIRNLEAGILRENFLVSAVASILVIRFYLFVTGYPQIGSGGLHIAHVLFGGLFMLAAFIMLFSFLDKRAMYIASILGGIGFGTFIDELGKFVTSDNDYFYQPTVALIYIVFVLVYLAFKTIPKYPPVSEKEYLINAIELTKEAVINDLDIEEEKRAMEYLKKADKKNPIVKALVSLLESIEAVPAPRPGWLTQLRINLRQLYLRLAKNLFITKFIIFALLLQSLAIVITGIVIFLMGGVFSFTELGKFVTAVIAVMLALVGILTFRKSREMAYQYFKLSVLVLILLTQFFIFYTSQFNALLGLAVNIIILTIIDYVLLVEREKGASAI